MERGPYSLHQWRQADCLSITNNYYVDNLNFLEPEVNWVGSKGNEKTVSEFPLIYFTVGNLWKVFGKHYFIYRLINLSIVLLGLFLLYKSFQHYLSDNFWSLAMVLFLFSSPLLAYYSNSFIANTPAFGFALIGLYFTSLYYQKFKIKHLYLSCLFFLLGGLLKLTALMPFIGLLPIHLYFIIFKSQKKNKVQMALPLMGVFAFIVVWYSYAKYYNSQNISGIFLQGLLPIWELTSSEIKVIAVKLYNTVLPSYFNLSGLLFIISIFIYSLVNYKKANKALLLLTASCFLGSFMFLLLFFKVFNVHDYYLTNLLIIVPLALITFFDILKRHYPSSLSLPAVKAVGISVVLIMLYNASLQTRIKYDSHDPFVKNSFIFDEETQNFWNWYHWNYRETFTALETIEPYLRELGIERNDRVISMPDQSINISLFLMNQKGFSDFGYRDILEGDRIEKFIELGAEYLIINDSKAYSRAYLKPYLTNKIGTYKNIDIYSLSD
jgi:hypothetical protein